MATTSTRGRRSSMKAKTAQESAPATAPATEAPVRSAKKAVKPRVRKSLDPNMYVPVKNGFHGRLIFRDKVTGEQYEWSEFGDEIDLTLNTLQKARSGQRRFFEDNWFLIDDPEVIEFLNVGQYYKNALNFDEFESIFDLGKDELIQKVQALSDGQKRGVIYIAKQKIESGVLYDLNVIKALEETLDVDLIEK